MDQRLIDEVRNGAVDAVNHWADAVARAGATATAELLRWLPRFHAMIAEEVRLVSPQFGFAVMPNRSGTAWWWIGDMCSESDNDNARRLGRLIAAWNETHPAVEWLLRRFGFPRAIVETDTLSSNLPGEAKRYDLTAGQHLAPIGADDRILKLHVPPWEPE